jgi:hypothetical protein
VRTPNQAPPRTREDILLHEFMHVDFLGRDANGPNGLDDNLLASGRLAYGPALTHALAQQDTILAITNADNYAIFAMATWMNNIPVIETLADLLGRGNFWDFNFNPHEQIDPPTNYARVWWGNSAWNVRSKGPFT